MTRLSFAVALAKPGLLLQDNAAILDGADMLRAQPYCLVVIGDSTVVFIFMRSMRRRYRDSEAAITCGVNWPKVMAHVQTNILSIERVTAG